MKHLLPLDPDEFFVLSMRLHWVVLLNPLFMYVSSLGLGLLVFFLPNFFPENWLAFGAWVQLFGLVILMVVHHWLFIYLFHWELSRLVVTNKRVIVFQFFPYVQHDAKFLIIRDIHEIEKEKRGLIQNVLNYGDLLINLSATLQPVELHAVPRVGALANLIQSILDAGETEVDLETLKKNYYS